MNRDDFLQVFADLHAGHVGADCLPEREVKRRQPAKEEEVFSGHGSAPLKYVAID
jgi:hypothetical protein